ncbi:MAG TPA: hypothetical protein VJ343_02065 [archaeon]|nr:hypothetical protein [archaeon]
MPSFTTDALFSNDIRTGIIPALDISLVTEKSKFQNVVRSTADVDGVLGYKLSGLYSLRKGLETTAQTLNEAIDSLNKNLSGRHKKILDYQKFGSDGGAFMKGLVRDNHELVDAFIYFPFTGPMGQKAIIEEIRKYKKVPIAGGKVTFVGAPESEGGYIPDSVINRMYLNSVLLDVPNYVFPASRPDDCQFYKGLLEKLLKEIGQKPNFFPTGLGKQGGDLIKAMDILSPSNSPSNVYFIVGREISEAPDPREAARKLAEVALQHDTELLEKKS